MEGHVQGTLRVTHWFLPMRKDTDSATVVNFTSGLADVPIADASMYSPSKAALASWTKHPWYRLRATNASAVEVSPPMMDTRMTLNNPASEGRKTSSTAMFDMCHSSGSP